MHEYGWESDLRRSSETDKPRYCCLRTDNGSWGGFVMKNARNGLGSGIGLKRGLIGLF